ncbi:MAG: CYTH domain-containing protein [Traorella sp.]
MINNIEIEFKILVNKEKFEELSNLYPNKQFIKQVNTYYDTKNYDLRKKHCAMRIREKENTYMITLKVPTTKGHEEFECFVDRNNPEVFKSSDISIVLHQLGIFEDVEVIGECTTNRAIVKTDKAELCFDINEYNSITDYEIEYEQTCDHDGISEFNKILSKVDLRYEKNCASKIRRTLDSK